LRRGGSFCPPFFFDPAGTGSDKGLTQRRRRVCHGEAGPTPDASGEGLDPTTARAGQRCRHGGTTHGRAPVQGDQRLRVGTPVLVRVSELPRGELRARRRLRDVPARQRRRRVARHPRRRLGEPAGERRRRTVPGHERLGPTATATSAASRTSTRRTTALGPCTAPS
jgi:hypothetical protein